MLTCFHIFEASEKNYFQLAILKVLPWLARLFKLTRSRTGPAELPGGHRVELFSNKILNTSL